MKKMVLPSLLMAVSSIMLVNCSEYTDFDVSQKLDAVQRMNEYSNSFKEIYGEIPADKSWDFTKSPKAATRANENVTITDGESMSFTKDFITKVSEALPEQNAINSTYGTAFALMYQGPFDIYPLWHGQCQRWSIYINGVKMGDFNDIMIKLNDKATGSFRTDHDKKKLGNAYCITEGANVGLYWDVTLGTKSNNFQKITANGKDIGYLYTKSSSKNNNNIYATASTNGTLIGSYTSSIPYNSTSKMAPQALTTTGWHIEGFEQGEILRIEMILEESNDTYDNPTYGRKGDVSTTVYAEPYPVNNTYTKKAFPDKPDQLMKFGSLIFAKDALKTKGIELPDDQMIIMFEDGHREMCDMDYNDVIFLIQGRPTPPVHIETDTKVLRWSEVATIEKRYMVEDLGATAISDIDFNDIVVDLKDVTEKKFKREMTTTKTSYPDGSEHETTVYGEILPDGETVINQSAVIRAMGGTMDFSIKFGEKDDIEHHKEIFRKSTTSAAAPKAKDYNWEWGFGTEEKAFDWKIEYNSGGVRDGYYEPALDYSRRMCYVEEVEGGFGWIPKKNNIIVYVYDHMNADSQIPDGNDYSAVEVKEAVKITFPENGTVPCMVAFQPTVKWHQEGRSINGDELNDKAYVKGDGTVYTYFSNYRVPAENE